jgi:hypothetical protein
MTIIAMQNKFYYKTYKFAAKAQLPHPVHECDYHMAVHFTRADICETTERLSNVFKMHCHVEKRKRQQDI